MMFFVLSVFLYGDFRRLAHYCHKRWSAYRVEKVRFLRLETVNGIHTIDLSTGCVSKDQEITMIPVSYPVLFNYLHIYILFHGFVGHHLLTRSLGVVDMLY